MTDHESIVAAGWCAPSQTVYQMWKQEPVSEPIVRDRLMRPEQPPLPHICVLPDPAEWTVNEVWPCPRCPRWWRLDNDYCIECGRSDPPKWVRGRHPLEGPERENGLHYLKLGYIGIDSIPWPSVARGGIRFDIP